MLWRTSLLVVKRLPVFQQSVIHSQFKCTCSWAWTTLCNQPSSFPCVSKSIIIPLYLQVTGIFFLSLFSPPSSSQAKIEIENNFAVVYEIDYMKLSVKYHQCFFRKGKILPLSFHHYLFLQAIHFKTKVSISSWETQWSRIWKVSARLSSPDSHWHRGIKILTSAVPEATSLEQEPDFPEMLNAKSFQEQNQIQCWAMDIKQVISGSYLKNLWHCKTTQL